MADTKQKTGAKPSRRVLEKRHKKRQGESNEPTKEEYAVAKCVRFKCPTKSTTFGHGMGGEEVKYFIGSKAVDCLMESKWSSKKVNKKTQPLFTDRQSCVNYMQQLLMKGLFLRAKKLVPKVKEKTAAEAGEKKKDRKNTAEVKDEPTKSPKSSKEMDVKRRKKEKEQKEEDGNGRKEGEKEDEDGNTKGKEKTSKTRKVRLDFHADQLFIDGPSIYVWKYDPTPMKTFLLGLVIVLGAIALCLFPLWPLQIRAGVYYLSLAAMGLFGAFIGLVVLRSVLFGVVWLATLGRRHFWLLPNLTEDCGVLESFQPLYSHKDTAPGSKPADGQKKKDKKSDSEDDAGEDEEATAPKDVPAEDGASATESESDNEDEPAKDDESVTGSQGDSDSEPSDGSSTDNPPSMDEASTSAEKGKRRVRRDDGRDSNNGDFEFVEGPPNSEL